MKPPETYRLEFLTPCFCAGALPSVAEIRPPSIRGKLRWWFRVLGGTPKLEAEVFGAIQQGIEGSSAVVVRVQDTEVSSKWHPFDLPPNSERGYLLYFAQASAQGQRWKEGGAIPKGASFTLNLVWRRRISPQADDLFRLALRAFLMLGSLGLRSTRGLGAFECASIPFTEASFLSILEEIRRRAPGFHAGLGEFTGTENQWLDGLGAQLKGLRKGFPPDQPSALGSSNPRQASAVHLRPVRDGARPRIVIFEAPAERVLGTSSRRRAPRIGSGIPQPADGSSRARRYR